MPSTIGSTKDLNASRTEALQGLLSSLGNTNDGPSGTTLSTEQLQKLSDKMDEILGDGVDHNPTMGSQPSQLMSEDGLPIIDISELVNEDSQTSGTPSPFLEQDLTPFSRLSPDEMERRRRDRDRILDMLEEEERLQQLNEERDAEEERRDAIKKRKESAKVELDQLKAARELQKKMGRALVQDANSTGENRPDQIARSEPQITSLAARKSVPLVDPPTAESYENHQQTSIHQPGWGDVVLGRLRTRGRTPLVSKAEAQKNSMKVRVVERRPAANPTSPSHDDADSDDEFTSPGRHLGSGMEIDFSDEEDKSSSSDNGSSDNEPLEEDFDYDTARHQREIALEYHKKRHVIGAETAEAMAAHTLDDYGQHETTQSSGRLPLSRFRADRMAAAYDKSQGSVSTQTVIPASRQRPLQNSVRLGKLENNQLAGGTSGESGSEDEAAREVIQMLKAGSIQSAGPDFESSSTPPRTSDSVQSPSAGTLPAAHGVRPSKFRLARGGRLTEATVFQDNDRGKNAQSHPAILSVVERRVPRSLSSRHSPVNKPPLRSPGESFEPVLPMIVDSPSSPKAASTSAVPIPSPSPAHFATNGSSSPHQMQLERPPLIKSSTTQDSKVN